MGKPKRNAIDFGGNEQASASRNASELSDFETALLSPAELARHWRVSRSTVDRVTRREGLSRICLGTGRNGTLRFKRSEVEEMEKRKTFKVNPEISRRED